MEKEPLKKAIEQYIRLTKEEWSTIEPLFKYKIIKKGDYLIRPGQVCDELCFILKGGFRIYNINEKGEEIVSWLPFEGHFISESMSFFSRGPTPEYIQALEDTELLAISYDNMVNLYEQLPKWETFGRLRAEESLIQVKKYFLSHINETAEDRYGKLMEESPEILQRVPLKDIASYIGVIPSSLSRIRREFAQ